MVKFLWIFYIFSISPKIYPHIYIYIIYIYIYIERFYGFPMVFYGFPMVLLVFPMFFVSTLHGSDEAPTPFGALGFCSTRVLRCSRKISRCSAVSFSWRWWVDMSLGIFIELDDGKIYRKPLYLMVKTMVSCKFSLKPIQWDMGW